MAYLMRSIIQFENNSFWNVYHVCGVVLKDSGLVSENES